MKKKFKKYLSLVFLLLCFIGVLYFSYKIITYKKDLDVNDNIKNEINEFVIKENENKYNIDFKSLKEKNPDTVAYIKVNNSKIDYVVVKGKDNKYYLKHNFNKEKNRAGWIFADFHNKFDESDKNIVIYGHNMNNGSMFGTLKYTMNKEWYLNEDNYMIDLVTENKIYTYQVFSIYRIDAEDYYINTIFKTDKEFEKFVKKIKSRSVYKFNVDVTKNDKILTLSSCVGIKGKRVALHAKLVEEVDNT